MKALPASILFLLPALVQGQMQDTEQTLHGLTTIVSTVHERAGKYFYSGYGSGFFYHQYKAGISLRDNNPVDSTLESIWLVTNKHVVFGKDHSHKVNPPFPHLVEFYLRKKVAGRENPAWDTIRIRWPELVKTVRLHRDSLVDVVVIDITDRLLSKLVKGDSLYQYAAVSSVNFPSSSPVEKGVIATTGSPVLAVGYPRKFYDTYNLFPTVKAGIIASRWMTQYRGQPYFLIDCRLFPGSSGSIVISNYASDGRSKGRLEFLGIYSGELYRERKHGDDAEEEGQRENFDTGNVWYYYLVEEIISSK